VSRRLVFFTGFTNRGGSGELGKLTKNEFLGSIVQTVTSGVNYNFSYAKQCETLIMDGLSAQTIVIDGNYVVVLCCKWGPNHSVTNYRMLVKLRVKEVFLSHVFLTTSTNR
jgi:hypothetical protein